MTNTILFSTMINRYNTMAFTHQYIWGFSYKGNIYMAMSDASLMPYICCLDKASRGAGYALRFKPTNDQKILLLQNSIILCSEKFFDETVASSKYNNGEIFEKMVTEYFGQKWKKDRVPFTEDGDITIKGVAYQIKYQKATFCNERTLANLSRG